MGFFEDNLSYLTQQEINYCQRLNETLDAHQASEEVDKCSYSKSVSFFANWWRWKQKQNPRSKI
jgi:hypothetical protein